MIRGLIALVSFVQCHHPQVVEGIVDDECCCCRCRCWSLFGFLPAATGRWWFGKCSGEGHRIRRSWARIRGVVYGQRVFWQFVVRLNDICVISPLARRREAWRKTTMTMTMTIVDRLD